MKAETFGDDGEQVECTLMRSAKSGELWIVLFPEGGRRVRHRDRLRALDDEAAAALAAPVYP